MRIKTKLSAGLLFLFLLFLVVGGVGAYYITMLTRESDQITEDNYESVAYTRAMLAALDSMERYHTEVFFGPDPDGLTLQMYRQAYHRAVATFEKNLRTEQNNITEVGEGEMVASLRRHLDGLQEVTLPVVRGPRPAPAYYFNKVLPASDAVRRDVLAISEVNLEAINRKNARAQQMAKEVLASISLVGVVAFIAYFTFLLNFPGYIAGPIGELSESIRQIAARNYGQRLHFESDDEFGEVATAFNNMAKKLDEYEHSNLAEVLFEKKRLDTVINRMHDAIIGLDEELQILFINREAARLLHVQESDVAEQYASDVAIHNDLMRNLLQGLLPPYPPPGSGPLRIVVNDKESYFSKEVVEVAFTPTGENEVRKIGYVIVLKNITRFQELDTAKTNFIATISHELKTPISSINMSLRLLEDKRVGALNEEQQHLVDTVKDEAQRLLKLTGELLDLTQAETGKIQLHYQETKPKEIIAYAHEALRLQAAQKHLQVGVHVPDDLPQLHIDREKTAWVMVNLLSNAVRYSPEKGQIHVRAGQLNGSVVFSVQDFGKGIDPRYQERIFERYFRVPEGGSNAYGTGLGLAISREFITAQGGKIWVESQPGAGSRFLFALPVA